jgi:protocatechuate 3,4-dioxygenase beta subunit
LLVGIFTSLARLVWGAPEQGRSPSGPHFAIRHRQTIAARRGFAIEPLEERKLLAADIQIGAVYYEEASGEDLGADVIEITFDGGAEGTQLTRLEFDTDKLGDGLTIGDVFFDTANGGLGAFGSSPLELISRDGIDSVNFTVADGGTTLVFTFTGFDAGERLLFQVDVDEQGFLGPNAVAEGNEFEGTKLTAQFAAPHYYDTTGGDIFIDAYDGKLATSGLSLPPDSYVPPGGTPNPVRTAGAIFPLTQTPLPVSIAGTVFEDVNLNNVQEAGDPGIAGVTLELFVLDGSTYVTTGQSTTTNGVGDYRFDGLFPGEYRVVETQPSGYFSVGASKGTVNGVPTGTVVTTDIISDVVLLGGQDSIDNDFAESLPAELSGYVYHDVNNDGFMTSNEPGIAGVEVRVQRVGGEPSAPVVVYTDSTGFWAATGLLPGEYRAAEVQPGPYLDGLDVAGSAGGSAHNPGDLITGITLVSGQSGINYKFGELLPSSISGRVHADADGDCVLDPGETTLTGVTVYLLDASGARIDETTTDAKGEYKFSGLAPGVYGIEEVQPAGYFDGDEHAGSVGGTLLGPDSIINVTLTSGTEAVGYDFCEHEPVSIRGRVHADTDGDCVLDEGEIALSGVTIYLLDANGSRIDETTTDANGEYEFTGLAPGVYGVEEIQPAGYFDGDDHVGSAGGVLFGPDSIRHVNLAPGQHGVSYDFCEHPPVSISGFVYEDDDNDGVRDVGEAPIAGVLLTLLDASGNPTSSTTTTDASGYYSFDGLAPGRYGVREAQPAGYFDGLDTAGTAGGIADNPGDEITGAVLDPGVDGEQYNFGELRAASVSGRVHADRDDDCVLDAGETPIGGVEIRLLNASGAVIDTTYTESDGTYEFTNLRPGTYSVFEVQPPGFFNGDQVIGSAGGAIGAIDHTVGITLDPGDDAVGYNFCEIEPASLSGHVYVDGNNDGVRDTGEPGIAGVRVALLDANGQPTGRTTTTDASGFYRFDNLEPGKYGVAETQPEGYLDGLDTAGSAGGTAMNPGDRISGAMLSPAEDAVNYDFGELRGATISGYVFQDGPAIEIQPGETIDPTTLRDGRFTPDDRPIAGTVLQLGNFSGEPILDGAGNPVTTVTDSNGYYEFTDLAPDVYSVREAHPNGYIDSLDTAGTTVGSLAINRNAVLPLGVLSTLSVSHDYDMIVRIVVDAGDVSLRNNFSEVTTTTTRPPQDIPPTDPLPRIVRPLIAAPAQPVATLPFVPRPETRLELLGGGPMGGYTWHLSIIDAGSPRGLMPASQAIISASIGHDVFSMYSGRTHDGRWLLGSAGEGALYEVVFGLEGAVPVTGDFNGDGVSELALYYEGEWLIDINGNGEWDADDLWAELGDQQDQPITGDWDGDGKTDIGIYGPTWAGDGEAILEEPGLPDLDNPTKAIPKNVPPETFRAATDRLRAMQMTAQGPIREDVIDHVFNYGRPDDHAITGDFNGDGIDTIGVFRHGQWRLDENGDGQFDDRDVVVNFGEVGDRPVVIDHNGNGVDELAVYRDGRFIIDANGNRTMDDGDLTIEIGQAGDVPVSGDFDGDGAEDPGVYRSGNGSVTSF